jgi:hypothetical protein
MTSPSSASEANLEIVNQLKANLNSKERDLSTGRNSKIYGDTKVADNLTALVRKLDVQ